MKFKDWLEKNYVRITPISKVLGISRAYVYLIANGQRKPSTELMEKIQVLTKGKVKPKDFE